MNELNANPNMDQLICENEALKKENAELKEETKILFDLVEKYDKELRDTTDVLEKTTDKLNGLC